MNGDMRTWMIRHENYEETVCDTDTGAASTQRMCATCLTLEVSGV